MSKITSTFGNLKSFADVQNYLKLLAQAIMNITADNIVGLLPWSKIDFPKKIKAFLAGYIYGDATFQDDIITSLTQKSIPFIGSNGLLDEDNSNLAWDDINKRVGIGTNVPLSNLHIRRTTSGNVSMFRLDQDVNSLNNWGIDWYRKTDASGTNTDYVGYIRVVRTGGNANEITFGHNMDANQEPEDRMRLYSDGSAKIGDISSGNTLEIESDGTAKFNGTARIGWSKKTANSVTLSAGTSAESVSDLQTANDGNVYHITEAAATPGITLIVDFVSITAFNWVNILGVYDGNTVHSIEIELYNWSATSWDHFNSMQYGYSNSGTVFENKSFFVPNDTNYIGTGGNAGKVRVRINHPMAGNASHNAYIDVVALYQ